MIQKVGTRLHPDSCKIFTYPMVKYDEDGWVDATKFLPIDYDLMYLKVDGVKGFIRGWYSGTVWDGLKYQEGQKVLYWKMAKE